MEKAILESPSTQDCLASTAKIVAPTGLMARKLNVDKGKRKAEGCVHINKMKTRLQRIVYLHCDHLARCLELRLQAQKFIKGAGALGCGAVENGAENRPLKCHFLPRFHRY
jgi:hypothetical protein